MYLCTHSYPVKAFVADFWHILTRTGTLLLTEENISFFVVECITVTPTGSLDVSWTVYFVYRLKRLPL
jgi:hypothetical protein